MSYSNQAVSAEQNEKNSFFLSLASVISAVAVVFMHVNGCFWNYSKASYWVSANVIESLMYFAVPVFFMISGATLLDYQDRYDTKSFFKKRINKTVIPYVFWSTCGMVFYILLNKASIKEVVLNKYIIRDIISAKYVSVFWFFGPLFGVYLCMPVLASIEKSKKIAIYKYGIIVGVFFNILMPFLVKFEKLDFLPVIISVTCVQGYLIFVLIGYVIFNSEIEKKNRYIVYCLAIIGFLLHVVGTYYLSVRDGEVNQTFKTYTNLPSLLYSSGVFLLFKDITPIIMKRKHIVSVVNFLKKYTFAIYLLHWFILNVIVRILKPTETSLIYRIAMPIAVILICCIVTILLRKIKIIGKLVP